MKDLKEILFENMYRTVECFNCVVLREDREFQMHEIYVLWNVILEAGLYEEYNKYATLKKLNGRTARGKSNRRILF